MENQNHAHTQYNIYLAARYGRADEMRRYASALIYLGHNISSEWHDTAEAYAALDASTTANKEPHASKNINDILESSMLVLFTEFDSYTAPGNDRGGRHVEFGYALAAADFRKIDYRIIVIGPRENVFHWLSDVEQYYAFDEFWTDLKSEQPTS